jgi:Transposase DDE domain.
MAIVNGIALESNKNYRIDFSGGDLSSDGGLLLVREFYHKLGVDSLVKEMFHTTDPGHFRFHKDHENLLQMLYQITAAYFQDDHADALRNNPVMTAAIGKAALASQPTLSRFHNRMDEVSLMQLQEIHRILRRRVYSVNRPEHILFDLDTTLFPAYGNQEGEAFNYHYQAHGYHPLLCFDGMTGDLLKLELRPGAMYCSNGAAAFMKPLLEEYQKDYPDVALFLRGDSGFATQELYALCETNSTSYAIRLKENAVLRRMASELDSELYDMTSEDAISYAVVYGEFEYKAGSWDYPRRIVCKIEKPYGQMLHMHTFVVTNMDSSPEELIRFYCKRGQMENFIKECKSGFDMEYVSSSAQIVNANRVQIHALAYSLFNWFRRLSLPEDMKTDRIDTVRLNLLKIAVRVVRSARYVFFKLCSHCPFEAQYLETLCNIRQLHPQLE